MSRDYDNLRQENAKLKEQVTSPFDHRSSHNLNCSPQAKEGEQTLEELGQQLSWSKLQVKFYLILNLKQFLGI